MDWFSTAADLFLHLDRHLAEAVGRYGTGTYVLLSVIIFCETGLVVTPFLPGDSLLFAAGTVAALGALDPGVLVAVLAGSAIAGDNTNYWIGRWVGPRAFSGTVRFLNRRHLERTHAFYERHGGKTIFLARFVPIVRTFAPFVAGIGHMSYGYFITYNFVGGITWVALFTLAGYFFGNIPFVKENFEFVIVAIVLISVVPIFIEWLRSRRERQMKAEA
jgi:membrane-associated protein